MEVLEIPSSVLVAGQTIKTVIPHQIQKLTVSTYSNNEQFRNYQKSNAPLYCPAEIATPNTSRQGL